MGQCGSDKNPYECPARFETYCNVASQTYRERARKLDLNYLRTFHPLSGGTAAIGIDNDYPATFKYDARITTNPPPLFQAEDSSSGAEVGY